jgi:hypothetical protein
VVNYTLGVRLLACNDDSGMALLERAMELDPWEIARCCESLRDYCWRKGCKDEAHDWHRRMMERVELEQAAKKERDSVRTSDKFERHAIDGAFLVQMQAQLRAIEGLRKAYFVKKRVKHMPERLCYVLGFAVRGMAARAAEGQRASRAPAHPGDGDLSWRDAHPERRRPQRAFGRKFRWMRGSRIV